MAKHNLESRQRIDLGFYPTPLHEIRGFREALGGGPRLFIKRDDCNGFAFGGNKVRKLEFELAAARTAGAQTVITVGAVQSNHCRQTAAAAARMGMKCVLVQNGDRPNHPSGNALLNDLSGAEIHYVSSREQRDPTMHSIANELRSKGTTVYEIPLGASTPLGACGYARAAGEFAEQLISQGGLKPTHIFVASSSGGTQGGLEVGLRIYGLDEIKVVGVSADATTAELQNTVSTIANSLLSELGAGFAIRAGEITALDQYIGAGYGLPTKGSEEAIRLLAKTEGIFLDPVYTSKAMAGLIDNIRSGKLSEGDTVVFWHTGGAVVLFA